MDPSVSERAELHRAYSLLHVKAVEDSGRVIAGVATTPSPDRVGDIVEPLGVKFRNPMPLLLFHDHKRPVGTVTFERATPEGIRFTAHLPEISRPGPLKERVDEAVQMVALGMIRAVSIGFRALEDGVEILKSGGLRFLKTEVLELSLVPVPANQEALIETVKSYDSYDASDLAAIGNSSSISIRLTTSRDRGAPVVKSRPGSAVKKTYSEQIKDFEMTRAAKQAELEGVQEKASGEGRGKDASEREQFDTLKAEIEGIDAELKDLRELERLNVAAAKAVTVPANPAEGSALRGSVPVVSVKENTPPGIAMARVVIAKMASFMELQRGSFKSAESIAKERWPGDQRVTNYLVAKTAVAGGTSVHTDWATELVEPTTRDFIEYLRHRTVIGRLNLQRRPFNIRTPRQTTGGAGYWVGEGKPKPLTKFHFDAVTLPYTKVAAISVITQELARFSQPSAEAIVRDQLAAACQERLDTDLLDPDKAASSGVNPASLTNGVTALSSAGVAAANVITDISNLVEQFILNRQDPSGLVIVMPNVLCLVVSLMLTTNGQKQFPDMTINGGTLCGIPVIGSQYAASASSYGNMVIAIDQNAVALADDGGFSVDVSTEASLQMDDAPTNDATTGTGQSLVSMFQTNSIAIRAEREIHWIKLRSTAVSYIDDVNWGSIGSPA